jgi:regulator of protease activity HflC (stomatin/prohibitin superfamily)
MNKFKKLIFLSIDLLITNQVFNKPMFRRQQSRNFITVINQAEVAYREFLGKNRVQLNPGLRINIPILHTINRVSLKEHFVNLDKQSAYTKDNVPVTVSGTVFYKITDPEKVCFSISKPVTAVKNVGESSFRAVIGKFDYDEIISNRNDINNEMLSTLGKTTLDWGINTTRLEIQDFGPQNKDVAQQLEKQMQAERSRRENELQTQADIRTAEGAKQIAILNSEGLLISAKNRSDALKYELTATSSGLGEQIECLAKIFGGDYKQASNYLLEMKRLDHLEKMAQTDNKVYFMNDSSMFPKTKIICDLVNEK